jgi:ParB-like chromosome segregation protein Spo0J
MKISMIALSKLNPAPYNPRTITPAELAKLTRSIEEFGIVEPLVVNRDMTIIGGHKRLKAVQSLGRAEIPCIVVDLPKNKEKLLNLALNRIGGDFDEALLSALLADLSATPDIALDLSGFDDGELSKMISRAAAPSPLIHEDRPLRPFCKTHILLSFPPERLLDIQPYLTQILAIPGVEYEQGSNG